MADTGHLKTNLHELVKQYVIYDGSGRMTDVYEARADAVQATPCLRTQYTYDGVSSRVEKRKESAAAWDITWDM